MGFGYWSLYYSFCRKSETAQASSNSVAEEQAPAKSASAAMVAPKSPPPNSAAVSGFASLSVQVSWQGNENL